MEDWAEAWVGDVDRRLRLGSAWANDVEAGEGVGRRR